MVNKEIKKVLRTLRTESKRSINEWPDLLSLVQYILNQTPVASLGNLSPVEVFAMLETTPALRALIGAAGEKIIEVPEAAQVRILYEDLCKSMRQMHKQVDTAKQKGQEYNKKKRPQRKIRQPEPANFEPGDFVLWAAVDARESLEKLQVNWRGPFRVVEAHDMNIFTIEHMITKKERRVHATRLRFYHDASLNVTEALMEHIGAQGFELKIGALRQLRYNGTARRYEILTNWEGFEDVEDSWEPFTVLLQDIPALVFKFLHQQHAGNQSEVEQVCHKHKKELRRAKTSKKIETYLPI